MRVESCGGYGVSVPVRSCPTRLAEDRRKCTPATFHARFIASRMPAPMPCPMNGGVRCAASPSRKMFPRRHRSADLGPERVFGHADQFEFVVADARGPRGDERMQRGQGAEVVGGFVWQEPKLPAVAGRTDPHVGAGASRIAYLVYALPLVEIGVGGRRRRPASAARISNPAWLNRLARAPRCWRRRSPARNRRRHRARAVASGR